MFPAEASSRSESSSRSIRTMIVDDSVVIRGLVSRWLGESEGIEVVATARSGLDALAVLERVDPDVIILDLDMPDMDGFTALPLIMSKKPGVCVLVASSLGGDGGEEALTLQCLQLGATDFLPKPGSNREVTTSGAFRAEIVSRVQALGGKVARRRLAREAGLRSRSPLEPAVTAGRAPPLPAGQPPVSRALRRPTLLVIGASTGGPNAILTLLSTMPGVIRRLPVVIVQHMPATFTRIFSEHLARQLHAPASEAGHGDRIVPGHIYVAPGGRHVRLEGSRGSLRALLDDTAPVNFCKPSVDVLFASAAASAGATTVGVVLTGMGADGAEGAAAISKAGGAVFAQDEASSVVWGMPGAVTRAGLATATGSAIELGAILNRFIGAAAA